MRAVVIGGAGFLGTHLIEYLLEKKYKVVCLDKKGCDSGFLENLGVPVEECDVMHTETVKPHIQKGDWVFHLAAYLGKAPVSGQQYRALNIEAAEGVCSAAIERQAAKFIFPSSMAAMGPVGSPEYPMNEDTECRPQTLYGRTKLEAEQRITRLVENQTNENKMSCLILRPPPFFGPRMNPITSSAILFKKMGQKKFIIIGDTQNYFPLCYVKNLAAAMVDLAEKKGPERDIERGIERGYGKDYERGHTEHAHTVDIYLIADGPPVKFNHILMTLRQEIGINEKIFHLPYKPVYAIAAGLEFLGKILKFSPLLSTDIVDGMCKSVYYYDISKALAAGYQPPCTLEEGIHRTVKEMEIA